MTWAKRVFPVLIRCPCCDYGVACAWNVRQAVAVAIASQGIRALLERK